MILQPIHAQDKEFRLLQDEEAVVGRKECGVLINGDPSISRVHAKLFTQVDGTVFLTDMSKYGTTVNNKKLNKEQRYQLKEGDLIKFGNQPNKSEFRLAKVKWIFCCSNMNANQKGEIKKSANKLGGTIVDTWNGSCSHLVMDSIVVTVKVVNALSSLKPIVTPKWLEDCVSAIRNGNTIPDHADYLPEVIDKNCKESKACFLPNVSRSHLLLDKVFYFLTEKQYNRLHDCITNGGGSCHLAASRDGIDDMEELVSNNAVVMSVDSNTLSSLDHGKKEWIQEVLAFVKNKGYRAIVDSEVGLALLHVSTEKDCNPLSHQITDSLPPPTLSQQRDAPAAGSSGLSDITVYADDTLFGSLASDVLNSTPSMLRAKNMLKSHKAPVKRELKEEEEVPISLSVAPDAVSSNGLSQSATNKYFEPVDSPTGAVCTNCPSADDNEEKAVPSLDGLSCSPSTFHPSPIASTSVIVPGTYTQKDSKENDVKAISNFFSSRKRKIQESDIIDLTNDKQPSPRTPTTNTSISIYNVLAKRNKRGPKVTEGSSSRKSIPHITNEAHHTTAKDSSNVESRRTPHSEIVPSSDEIGSTSGDSKAPVVDISASASVNDGALQQVDSMETSDSQRPVLSRFQRFTRRKTNGFISARITNTTTDDSVEQCIDGNVNLPIAPIVLCEHVSLVVHPTAAVTEAALDALPAANGVINFKKFKKARYVGIGGLPTIIGSTQLAYFDRETTTLTQEWQRGFDEPESPRVVEEPDPFEMIGSRRRR